MTLSLQVWNSSARLHATEPDPNWWHNNLKVRKTAWLVQPHLDDCPNSRDWQVCRKQAVALQTRLFNHLQSPIDKWIELLAICIRFAKQFTKLLNTMSIPIQMPPAWSYTIIARTSIKVDLICLTNSLWFWWPQPLPTCSLLEADFASWQTMCQGHYPFANTTGRNGGLRNKCDTKNTVPLLLVNDLLLLQQRSPERHHNLHSAAHPGTKF